MSSVSPGDTRRRLSGEATLDRFRQVLREALFTDVDGGPALDRGADDPAREVLVRLFLAGRPCPVASLRRALPAVPLDGLEALGIVEREDGMVVPRIRLLAYSGLIIASSPEDIGEEGVPADYVMGVGMSSMTLADLTIRTPVERTLDLGCGSGVQALLAARHSARVVAVDLNPRAAFFTQLNARLNQAPNVSCLRGDYLEPVREAAFDLVVANPPFVISPDARYLYRDSGLPADDICRRLVRTAPRHLREGGFCQVLCHWAHIEGQTWQERLAGWCSGMGCDAWVVQAEVWDPLTYVSTWVGTSEHGAAEDIARTQERWLRSMEELGIEAVGTGLVTVRRRPAADRNWLRMDEGPETISGPAGEQVLSVFVNQDFLDGHRDDRRLLDARLRAVPEVRLDEFSAPGAGAWQVIGTRLRIAGGLRWSVPVDPAVARFVGMCDGARSVGDILAALAADEPERGSALSAVRLLVERGLLRPRGEGAVRQRG